VRSAHGRRGLFRWRSSSPLADGRTGCRVVREAVAGGVVMHGDVGGDVLGEVGVGLKDGQGGGLQVLICAWCFKGNKMKAEGMHLDYCRNIRSVGGLTYELCSMLWTR